jgi:ribosomal protein S18 acetylase RimI-like enzyme
VRYIIRPARADELEWLSEQMAAAYLENLLAAGLPRDEAEALADFGVRQSLIHKANFPELLVIVTEDTQLNQVAAALAINAVPALKVAHGFYMWVRPEYRGRATFTRNMFKHTETLLAAKGIRRVEFGVFVTNDRAMRIYQLLGYRTTAQTMVKRLD